MEFTIHPVAKLFPLMSKDEYEALKADIKANGQLETIKTHEDQIVDGVHRYNACQELSITPKTEPWPEAGSLTAYVIAMNLKRRHLTPSQKAMIGNESRGLFAKEAKERQKLSKGRGKKGVAILPHLKNKTRDKAGEAVGVSGSYIDDAQAIEKHSKKLAKEVKEGKKSISQAKREMKKEQVKEKLVELPAEKFRVVYADPPWNYGNSGPGLDQYGPAERHYQSMTIAELCAMDIKSIVDDDAVLFLWVTSPLLAECWPVITAWGFKYKSSFVWDKIKHNFGHYNSVRHEFLLICTRGSCTPDTKKLYDSVVDIERSETHSEKPERFREIIDDLYPHGKRIELFARRSDIPNWDFYGNELP